MKSSIPLRDRATTPVPAPVTPEVAAYVRASERVAAALREQREALAALSAFEREQASATRITMLPPGTATSFGGGL